MTQPISAGWRKLLIQPETSAGAGTYNSNSICGLTTKNFEMNAATQETIVPDCDEDLPSWVEREIASMSGQISGSGILAFETFDFFRDWFLAGEARRCKVVLNMPLANNGGYFLASYVFTKMGVPAENGGKINVDMEFQSSGPITWVDAAS